jgi:protein MpaA
MKIFNLLIFLALYLAFYTNGFTQITEQSRIDKTYQQELNRYCKKMNRRFSQFGWKKIICNPKRWKFEKRSVNGDPLLYQTFFNDPNSQKKTFIFCGIHGDELPSVYLCIHLVRDIVFDNPKKYSKSNVIIAPLANPDSFFRSYPSRVNANGVDLNRNFPTKDWDRLALKLWKSRYHSAKRRYPGIRGGSEVETQFLVDIIRRFSPTQIVSVHGPYGFWDYDYDKKQKDWKKIRKIAHILGKKSRHFPVKDYRVFPGSLGNFAGNDLKIPTYTLELDNVRAKNARQLWNRFQNSLHYLITL